MFRHGSRFSSLAFKPLPQARDTLSLQLCPSRRYVCIPHILLHLSYTCHDRRRFELAHIAPPHSLDVYTRQKVSSANRTRFPRRVAFGSSSRFDLTLILPLL